MATKLLEVELMIIAIAFSLALLLSIYLERFELCIIFASALMLMWMITVIEIEANSPSKKHTT